MDNLTKYLEAASRASYISVKTLQKVWHDGEDFRIAANTVIGQANANPTLGYFLKSGIAREYFVDDKGNEHTLRFAQGPIFLSPGLNNSFREGQTELLTQALTTIEGRAWKLDFMLMHITSDSEFFNSMMGILLDALVVKAYKDIRRHESTAAERYLHFLEEFPGVVNQVPLKYVASYLNMTPETISRIRNELSQRSRNEFS